MICLVTRIDQPPVAILDRNRDAVAAGGALPLLAGHRFSGFEARRAVWTVEAVSLAISDATQASREIDTALQRAGEGVAQRAWAAGRNWAWRSSPRRQGRPRRRRRERRSQPALVPAAARAASSCIPGSARADRPAPLLPANACGRCDRETPASICISVARPARISPGIDRDGRPPAREGADQTVASIISIPRWSRGSSGSPIR